MILPLGNYPNREEGDSNRCAIVPIASKMILSVVRLSQSRIRFELAFESGYSESPRSGRSHYWVRLFQSKMDDHTVGNCPNRE